MGTVDSAIARIQDIVTACTTVVFKSMPDYPIENADPFPMSAVYITKTETKVPERSNAIMFITVAIEFHLSRVNIKDTYTKMNAIAIEFPLRIAGDPTLNGTVDTVLLSDDSPLTGDVKPFNWGKVQSEMLVFELTFKTLQTPLITP